MTKINTTILILFNTRIIKEIENEKQVKNNII